MAYAAACAEAHCLAGVFLVDFEAAFSTAQRVDLVALGEEFTGGLVGVRVVVDCPVWEEMVW